MKPNLYRMVTSYFGGPKFPAFMILAMLFYQLFLAVTIFAPIGDGLWGRFLTDFRVWCFSYDPQTGSMQWSAAWILLTEPLILQGIILLLWRNSLWNLVRFRRRELMPQCLAALTTVLLIAGSFLWMAKADAAAAETAPPFPAERIRVALKPPPIDLINQHGSRVSLTDYRGQVVLLTGIYSTCGTACPMIMFQAKEVIEGLSEDERDQLTVMAISLDPEGDSLTSMARAAAGYRMDVPLFQFLNGDPEEVNQILDGLSIARTRNEATGQIDHANMYFLIDKQGRIAYRFTLSDRHQSWLEEALRLLIAEPASLPDSVALAAP